MYFVALIWDEADVGAQEEAQHLIRRMQARSHEWRRAFSSHGVAAFVTSKRTDDIDRTYVLADDHGLIVGRLFDRSCVDTHEGGAPAEVVLDPRAAQRIVADGGRTLIDRYWGRYVALLHDRSGNRKLVLRDPAGTVPCQWTQLGKVHLYFVRWEDCEQLGARGASINRHYLVGYLLYDSVCIRETAVQGVETVLPGECVEHRGSCRRRSFHWNPLVIARSQPIEDAGQAVSDMRRTVRACVHAWASCVDGLLLELSGGLDSSIVLSCLADAPSRPRIVASHSYGTSGDLDEREFARMAAQSAKIALIEQLQNPQFDLPPDELAGGSLSPFPGLYDVSAEERELQLMRAQSLSARFTGNGGDEIFYRSGPLPTAVDYAWTHGIRPDLLAVATDDAVASRVSFWRVMRSVWRYGLLKRRWHPRQVAPANRLPIMAEDVKAEAGQDETYWHPLYAAASALPPNKLTHAYVLTFGSAHGYIPGTVDNAPASISPLFSQPLLELSLRTPVYVLSNGGRDRAVARDAFASRVPRAIICRKSKGFGNRFLDDVLARHIAHAREMLLDGYLVSSGVLDRCKLEQALSGNLTRLSTNVIELATYLDVEKWVRSWSSRRTRIAA